MKRRCPPDCYSCEGGGWDGLRHGPPGPSFNISEWIRKQQAGIPITTIVKEINPHLRTLGTFSNGAELKGGGFWDVIGKIGNGLQTAINIAGQVAPAVGGIVNTFRGLKGGGYYEDSDSESVYY